jgi:hypothetical protein
MNRSRSAKYTSLVFLIAAATVAGGNVSSTASGHAGSPFAPGISTGARSLSTANLPAGVPKHGRSAFLLMLSTASTGATYDAARSHGAAAARSAARAQLRATQAAQNSVIADLPSSASVLYRAHAAASAVAVVADVKDFAALNGIRGVTTVYPIAAKKPSLSYSVPLQRAPQGWQAYGDLGDHVRIAVIDTGADYTHANFGGPGTVAAYQAALATDRTIPDPDSYDHAKFDATRGADGTPVGMYDFAGDAYNPGGGSTTPHPDPNPLDCTNHGSHVAGIAAGYGERADGSTYTGPYSTKTPFSTMRIGPGMAPHAHIYAYKVFGCEGDTNVVGAAIDKAMDPNGDGDTSDHVDVINMSLGSDYSSPQDGDATLTNMASELGVLVATSSGNGGDLFDIGGSPGSAVRAITAANSTDAYQQVDTLHVSAPAAIAGPYPAQRSAAYDYGSKPDLSGTVVRLTQPGNLDGCSPLNAADKAAVTGKIAFVEWTDDNDRRFCGSVARSSNLAAAGATGFIFGNDSEMFSAGITGSTVIPGVEVAKSGADPIREQLKAGATVQVSGTSANDFKEIDPSYNDTMINTGSSRGIGDVGNVKPDVAAVGTSVFSTGMGTGDEGLNDSGTSMASPMVAGEAALVRSMHPDWTPEMVKADIMNTADANLYLHVNHHGPKYAPQRVGAGRIDVKSALDNHVLAYDAAGQGSVSSSFGPIAVVANSAPITRTRTIKVQNTGDTTARYGVRYQARTTIPGARYSVSPSSVRVDPRSSTTVTLTLTIDPSLLTKTLDPTMRRVEQGLPRQFQADASGLVVFFNQESTLRVPTYSAPRPASAMTQPDTITMPRGQVSTGVLPLDGVPVNQGSGENAVVSKVAGFELQARSAAAPVCTDAITTGCIHFADERMADLKYVGVTSDAPQLRSIGVDPASNGLAYFALTTQGRFRTPVGTQQYLVWIDGDGDGVADSVLLNDRVPAATTGSDVFISELIDLNSGAVVDAELLNDSFGTTDTAIFDSDSIVVPVAIGAIPGLTADNSRIKYVVQAFSGYENDPIDAVGSIDGNNVLTHPLSFDVLHPGLAIYGTYTGQASALLYRDAPGTSLAVRRDTGRYRNDHAIGALIIHFHNTLGHKAQVVHLVSS